jgi:phage baseplate assembly protein W
MALYSGFSTINFNSGTVVNGSYPSYNVANIPPNISAQSNVENPGNNTFVLTDVRLVERNILNHIYTSKGSRVMMPNTGSTIPDLLFEPLDEQVMAEVRAELIAIVAYDPRVKLESIKLTPQYDKHILNVVLVLHYVELTVTKGMNFNLEFNI